MPPLIGLLTFDIHLPGCASLKEKRGRLSPLVSQLSKRLNLSVAEVAHQDVWQSAQIACVIVNCDGALIQRSLQHACAWVEENFPDLEIIDARIEFR